MNSALVKYMVFLMMLLLSCEVPKGWETDPLDTDLIVVEGLITNERTSHRVRLSKTTTHLNSTAEGVPGAFVAVTDGSETAVFAEYPTGSGYYYSDTLRAVVNREYTLYIDYKGKIITATARMVPVTPLKPLNYTSAGDGSYRIVFQDSNAPSKKEYWISWAHLPEWSDGSVGETTAKMTHYTLESIDVNENFKPDKEQMTFPAGAVVLRKKYSLSPNHQSYLRTLLTETEWRGSPFDVLKGNVSTNLSEGAVGYFAASMVVSDTTWIQP